MPEVIISDTSCLVVFKNAGRLDLLRELFGRVLVTGAVAAEYGLPLPGWIGVMDPEDLSRIDNFRKLVDLGEATSIALALEHPASRLIIDDWKGRQLAAELGIRHTGSIGVVKLAKDRGLIPLIGPVLKEIRAAGLWVSDDLERAVLREAGEL